MTYHTAAEQSSSILNQEDSDLCEEILQDVKRCLPENTYFRSDEVQQRMLNILFVFCKLNMDVGYRQGMHELLAPIIWVVEVDVINQKECETAIDILLSRLFDIDHVEHDSFTLFSLLMQSMKQLYEQKAYMRPSPLSPSSKSVHLPHLENPITAITERIFDDFLPMLDPELAKHLKRINLIPQVFLIRWVRLLFCREFVFDQVLQIWDIVLAELPTMDLLDLICIILILRLRWQLLESDQNDALSQLLQYPQDIGHYTGRDIVNDALRLGKHFTRSTAEDLIYKYSGRRPISLDTTSIPSPESFVIPESDSSTRSTFTSPVNLEKVFHDAAKGVPSQSERWGISRAVRGAVEEVKKGVREIHTMQTPRTPPRLHARLHSRTSIDNGTSRIQTQYGDVNNNDVRYSRLAGMLQGTADELWTIQDILSKMPSMDPKVITDLGSSCAQLGFIKAYLEDPSLTIPPADALGTTQAVAPQFTSPHSQIEQSTDVGPAHTVSDDAMTTLPILSTSPSDVLSARPTIAHSSFSWMLGQPVSLQAVESKTSPFSSTSSPRTKAVDSHGLFGEGDGEETTSFLSATEPRSNATLAITPTKRGKDRSKIIRRERDTDPNIGKFDDGFDSVELQNTTGHTEMK